MAFHQEPSIIFREVNTNVNLKKTKQNEKQD